MIDISIITLNYKEAELTKKCVRGLLKSKGITFEIILIDNSCDENEEKLLKKITDKRVHTHIMDENLGCAKGYNFGIQKAKGKYIFIINNDAEIDNSQGLLRMKKFMDVHNQIAVIQPKIKSSKNRNKFDYAGASGGYIDIYGYPFCRGRLFQTLEKDNGQYNDIVDISWASTCAFFARKDVIKKVGLFDPIYFAYAEEVDISIKIWNSGYKIQIFPEASVYHRGEASWKKMRAKKTFLIHRNHLILFFKCFSLTEIIFLMPLRIFYEAISIGFYIMTARSHLVLPILKAYVSIFILFPQIIKQRRKFFKNFQKNSMPKFKRSIIIFYYLQQKRKFSILNKKYLYG